MSSWANNAFACILHNTEVLTNLVFRKRWFLSKYSELILLRRLPRAIQLQQEYSFRASQSLPKDVRQYLTLVMTERRMFDLPLWQRSHLFDSAPKFWCALIAQFVVYSFESDCVAICHPEAWIALNKSRWNQKLGYVSWHPQNGMLRRGLKTLYIHTHTSIWKVNAVDMISKL